MRASHTKTCRDLAQVDGLKSCAIIGIKGNRNAMPTNGLPQVGDESFRAFFEMEVGNRNESTMIVNDGVQVNLPLRAPGIDPWSMEKVSNPKTPEGRMFKRSWIRRNLGWIAMELVSA